MSELKAKENQNEFSNYIKTVNNQEIKIILLKLKNEINKNDVTWEQVKKILQDLLYKDDKILNDIIRFIIK